MARFLARLVAANDGWAKPLGEFNKRWSQAMFRRMTPIRDLLNGTWLGHPLHAAVTDLPVGGLVASVALDLLGQPTAADIVLVGTIVLMVVSALTGLADYSETSGTALTRASLHSALMTAGLVLLVVSALLRWGDPADRTLPIAVSIIALAVVAAGAFVGGDVVYVLGNMVDRHAFRGAGTKWVRLDTGGIADLGLLPEATPTKMKAGINDLVVIRRGGETHVLHAVCAHAGGPLDQGSVTPDGCIQCPWHGARYRLTDGALRRGPSVYDQPSYELRAAEDGGYEVRRRPAR